MLAIISKYKEELNLATAHGHKVADEYARVYAEKEARGRVINSLHQEATVCFSLILQCLERDGPQQSGEPGLPRQSC